MSFTRPERAAWSEPSPQAPLIHIKPLSDSVRLTELVAELGDVVVRDCVDRLVVGPGRDAFPVDVRGHAGADHGRPVPRALSGRMGAVRVDAVTEGSST